ncbi:hypothetical protein BX666DRAFT_1896198 [Dichotomocladium elegans]|nr:hypothetical protein BX666DRAFT_1896198 [Dichotomocladium elegans]
MEDSSLNATVKPVLSKDTNPLIPPISNKICQGCQKNQMMIYKIMSDYIPDESDPNYDYYLDTANDYKHSLDEKYPICDSCKSTVDSAIAKLVETLQQKQLGGIQPERLRSSEQESSRAETIQARRMNTPRKLSSREDRWRMNLWILTHGLVLLFCVHACFFPQPASDSRTIGEDVNNMRMALDEMLASTLTSWRNRSWRLIFFGGPISILLNIGGSLQVWLGMMACFTTEDSGYCEKDYTQGLFPLLVLWSLSFLWMDWHYLGSAANSALCLLKGLWLYKVVQGILYAARIMIIFSLRYWDSYSPSRMMAGALAAYFLLLVFSIFSVKIIPNSLAIKDGRKITARSDPFWLSSWAFETKISQELLEAAQDSKYRRSTQMLMEEAAQYDEAYCEALKAVNKIRAKHGIAPIPIPVKPSWLSKDGGVGDISTGIDDLSFDVQS